MTPLTSAEMARAIYDEVFVGQSAADSLAAEDAVLRIPGFEQAWRDTRKRRRLRAQADKADAA